MRRFFVPSALLIILITGLAVAGQYQRTRDNKTLVWNEDHKPGELVSWSGKRDADGYATGYGTLTWYAPEGMTETGSNVPRTHYRISSRFAGTMARGKFVQASTRATEQAPAEPAEPKKPGWLSRVFRRASKPTPAPVEPTPKPRRKSAGSHTEETPEKRSAAPTDGTTAPTPTSTPSPSAAQDSLDSLMNAPSSLKLSSPPASASPARTPDVSLQPAEPASPSPSP